MAQAHHVTDWSDSAARALEVVTREFVVVTAESADLRSFQPLCAFLRRVRKGFGVTAAFICEASDGETFVRSRDAVNLSGADELRSMYGMRLLTTGAAQGRAHSCVAIPVITRDGLEVGTLCGRLADAGSPLDPGALDSLAQLIANWFDDAELSISGFTPLSAGSGMSSAMAAAW
ncbi:hypothetical protein [Ramlibacter sp.]|uniref:hypothetical protein n=1 Tax=Ramlibacter sp. TaxID=1917967 RepID=UPI003D148B26